MEFFDELGKKATKTYRQAARQTERFSKIAKLKMLMNGDKAEIEDLYEEMGKKVYEDHVREGKTNCKEFLEQKCTEIDLLSDEIEASRMEILALKNKKQCQNCYQEIELNYQYCPTCGQDQSEEAENIETEEIDEIIEEEEIVEDKEQ